MAADAGSDGYGDAGEEDAGKDAGAGIALNVTHQKQYIKYIHLLILCLWR